MINTLKSYYNNGTKFYLYYIGKEKEVTDLKNRVTGIGKFKYQNISYSIFYVEKDIQLEKDYDVTCFSYMISSEIYFINSKKDRVDKLIEQLYKNRIEMPGSFSSYHFNELVVNRINYIEFLMEMKTIEDKYIIDSKYVNNKIVKDMVIKLPYSDTSQCVFINGTNIREKPVKPKQCFGEEGAIAEIFNYYIGEFKIMTLFGKIVYLVYHNVTKRKAYKVILDKDFNCDNKKIEKSIKPYKDQIIKLIKKIYNDINLLINIMIKKIDEEIKLYQKFKLKEENLPLMTSLFYHRKIKHVEDLSKRGYKTERLLNLLDTSFFDYYIENKNLFKTVEITDPFIRIDIKLPDFINYDKVMLVELASYNSGKSKDLIGGNKFDKFRNSYYITEIMKKRYSYYKKLSEKNVINLGY